ncbi:MAG: hypothetical protein IPO91_19930 [Chloroflexi bacterium]|nr:hypothetical protein [Chloroflexota bacterium]
MNTREWFSRTLTARLLFDIWDDYALRVGPQQSRILPKGPLDFALIAYDGAPLPQPIQLVMTRNASGYYLFFGQVRLSSGDQRNQGLLPDGPYRLRVTQPDGFYQSVTLDVVLPSSNAAYPIALEPGATYPYLPTSTGLRSRVLDSALAAPDNRVAGVRVTVRGFPCSALSDRDGGWSFYLPEPDRMNPLPRSVEINLRHPTDNRAIQRIVQIEPKKLNKLGDFEF